MKAITIRQPWAHAILHWGKDVENRSWYTSYRGPLLIHASAAIPPRDAIVWLAEATGVKAPRTDQGTVRIGQVEVTADHLRQLPRGCVVGIVNMYDCVQDSESRWAESGFWHWVFRNPRPMRPIACSGALRLWTAERRTLQQLPAWVPKGALRPVQTVQDRQTRGRQRTRHTDLALEGGET